MAPDLDRLENTAEDLLTLEMVERGRNYRETVTIKALARDDRYPDRVQIRPLTAGEQRQVDNLNFKGQKGSALMKAMRRVVEAGDLDLDQLDDLQQRAQAGEIDATEMDFLDHLLGDDVELDLLAFQDNAVEADYLAAAFGLSTGEQTWTPEQVAQLPVGAPEEIAGRVEEITNPDKESRRFRPDAERHADRVAAGAGDPAGTDAAGPDAEAG